jgi:hypothetical protein
LTSRDRSIASTEIRKRELAVLDELVEEIGLERCRLRLGETPTY